MGLYPALEQAIAALEEAGLLPAGHATRHLALTRFLVAERLLAPDASAPQDTAREVLARACGHDRYDALLRSLVEARQGIAAAWQRHFDERLEIEP